MIYLLTFDGWLYSIFLVTIYDYFLNTNEIGKKDKKKYRWEKGGGGLLPWHGYFLNNYQFHISWFAYLIILNTFQMSNSCQKIFLEINLHIS